jgi:hypothetical protein
MSNYGFILPMLFGQYMQSDAQWDWNCAENLSDALHRIEFMDTGTVFKEKYVRFLCERIACAVKWIDRENDPFYEPNTSSPHLRNEGYYDDLYQSLKDNYIYATEVYKKSDAQVFLSYFDLIAENYNVYGYEDLYQSLKKMLQVSRVRWNIPYDVNETINRLKAQDIERKLNQSLSLIAKYNRKSKGVMFLRPQISRKNLITIGVSVTLLVASVAIYRKWGQE